MFSGVEAYIYIIYQFISCYISKSLLYSFLDIKGANPLGGETTKGAKRLVGAKRLGGKRLGGKRLGGETTRGGNGFGAKRPGFICTPLCRVHMPINCVHTHLDLMRNLTQGTHFYEKFAVFECSN